MDIIFNIPDDKLSEFNSYFKHEVPKDDPGISDVDHFKSWLIRLTKDAIHNGQVKIANDGIVIDDIDIT